ncbi:DUF3999 family protein [Aquabacterium sp.]|uniref:DUF3999 family protein n=1 Tax=Aquabacterium sp. TaxID=1872578 RepID=UPI003784FA8E
MSWRVAAWWKLAVWVPLVSICLVGTSLLAPPVHAAEAPPLRYAAPLKVTQPAAFVQLPLPTAVYAHSQQPGLADLRLVDANGQRVPFALLAPREDSIEQRQQARPVALYALPPGPVGSGLPPSIELQVQADRISLRQRGVVAVDGRRPGAGWIVDLGEREAEQPAPRQLRLHWSAPAEFSVGYRLEFSDDLRRWHRGGGGQLMALPGREGALTQPLVPLEGERSRFVRLLWSDPAQAPTLDAAEALTEQRDTVLQDPPTELRPTAAASGSEGGTPTLEIDLGAVLPLRDLRLGFADGSTQLVPLRVQLRLRRDAPWRDVTQGVLYRIERPEGASVSPPLPLGVHARQLRLLLDERSPLLDPARVPVIVRAQLASLVFAAQGVAPYTLQVGAPFTAGSVPGPLPIDTLVPQLKAERARFGRASLGEFSEQPEAAARAARDEAWAAWRPRLLWAVLLGGVLALAGMVWRLARGRSH